MDRYPRREAIQLATCIRFLVESKIRRIKG